MTIIAEYAEKDFRLVFLNHGRQSQRIWEFDNSWGWNTLTWMIGENGNRSQMAEIRKLQTRAWTKNGPVFFELSAGDRRIIPVSFLDGQWELPTGLNAFKNKTVIVKARLDIPASPEATSNQVFVGTLESNELLLSPPHGWLQST